jgi:hypothetical protein
MLYSNATGPQYVTSPWIQSWLNYPQINGQNSLLSVGFDTDTEYENSAPDSQGGSCGSNPDGSYTCPTIPSGTSRGQAAFMTYQQAINGLVPTSTIAQFGPTFWWADEPQLWMNPTSINSATINQFWTGSSS